MSQRRRKGRGPNPYVILGYVLVLGVATALLYLPFREIPCPVGVPKEVSISPAEWMSLVGPRATKFRFVNLTAIEALIRPRSSIPNYYLIQVSSPTLAVNSTDVNYVLEAEYEQPERFVTVNVLQLKQPQLARVSAILQNSTAREVRSYKGLLIYGVQSTVESTPGGGPAYLAIRGNNLIYSERGPTALRMLEATIDGAQLGQTFLDSQFLREGILTASYLGGSRLGFSLTIFTEPLEEAKNIWRMISVAGGEFIETRVASFDTSLQASAKMNSARLILFDADSKVCLVENYLLSVKKKDVTEPGDIRSILAAL